jgi:SAM-dependent methyltransferase
MVTQSQRDFTPRLTYCHTPSLACPRIAAGVDRARQNSSHALWFCTHRFTRSSGIDLVGVTREMERDQVAEAYGRWAPIYDVVFGPVFRQGRRAAVIAAERVGGRVLEVGVGTGLSLADYTARSRVVGIDISEPMLEKARARAKHLNHVEALDATRSTTSNSTTARRLCCSAAG